MMHPKRIDPNLDCAHLFVDKIESGERQMNELEFCECTDTLEADGAGLIRSVLVEHCESSASRAATIYAFVGKWTRMLPDTYPENPKNFEPHHVTGWGVGVLSVLRT
jgi:hypothetical protein